MYNDKFNKIKEFARLHPELLEALTEQDLQNQTTLINCAKTAANTAGSKTVSKNQITDRLKSV